jgi:hypothetical protein
MEQVFRSWTQSVSKLGIIVGTGSPEGVVSAIQTTLYMDDSGSSGSILYIKRDASIAGDDSQGWVAV